jgi:hypothetical protein
MLSKGDRNRNYLLKHKIQAHVIYKKRVITDVKSMELKDILIFILLLVSVMSLGCLGTSIKEINTNPESNMGTSVELSGIVFTTEENGLWFEFTDDRRAFDRYSVDEYRIIYVHNIIGFDAEKEYNKNKPGDIIVKGVIKSDDSHGTYIEANSITLK